MPSGLLRPKPSKASGCARSIRSKPGVLADCGADCSVHCSVDARADMPVDGVTPAHAKGPLTPSFWAGCAWSRWAETQLARPRGTLLRERSAASYSAR